MRLEFQRDFCFRDVESQVSSRLIDLWKSYRPENPLYFIIDQSAHVLVLIGLWVMLHADISQLQTELLILIATPKFWILSTGLLFLTLPSAITIGILTEHWRAQIDGQNDSLANAGRWIGILERLIIFTLVIYGEYEAIGLLTAAKSILRFSENAGAPKRTEYVLIGTLISVSVAMLIGLLVKKFLAV